ncbi:hypothetical protein Acr_02g0005090 [Actinidia rufa]|uniref:Transmembrane protein n=1 Tax=Actinidia rufa TaxID=165716 RepID=A0A7J0E8K4_9ERIC|nr:hypothetical protein Acr_02g0005090 [Actinidia rufa]
MALEQLLSDQKRVREDLASSIKDKLSRLPHSYRSPCIYRVPERLRKVNEEAFTPRLVSIGPLHDRDKPHFRAMEDYKLRCLRSLLTRYENVFAIVDFIVREEAAIRQYYEDQTKLSTLNSKEFCENILLDSVFMVQLLLKSYRRNYKKEKDEIFDKHWMRCDLLHDMILIENQLPLFVPRTLYSNIVGQRLTDKYPFIDLVRDYFCKEGLHVSLPAGGKEPRHLVEYLRMAHISQVEHNGAAEQSNIEAGGGRSLSSTTLCCCCFGPKKMAHDIPQAELNAAEQSDIEAGGGRSCSSNLCCCCFAPKLENKRNSPPNSAKQQQEAGGGRSCSINLCCCCCAPKSENKKNSPPNSAKQLQEAGVKFEKGTESCLVDIKFVKGTLTLPVLKINEWTETFFRNLIAFEQCERMSPRHISDYIIFMDRLINTYKDVDVLINNKIFKTSQHDSKEVSELFNNLYKETTTEQRDYLRNFGEISGENNPSHSEEVFELFNYLDKESLLFHLNKSEEVSELFNKETITNHFAKISDELNDYSRDCRHRCKARWYNWNVNLKDEYFKSPWSVISVVAAFVLLVLTVVQTACSVISL